MKDYKSFLRAKAIIHDTQGIKPIEPHPMLFPFQRDIVKWALRRGKACVWADAGLGKTLMQIEWCRQVPGDTLIVAPLNVAQQTIREGKKVDCEIRYCRKTEDFHPGISIVNYEMLEKLDVSRFKGVALDECFAPGTMVKCFKDGIAYYKDIRHIRAHEQIINASGIDTVQECHRRKINRAYKITFNGQTIIASENHPWLTLRGWMPSRLVRETDWLLETTEAMRLVRQNVFNPNSASGEKQILREILLSEMADETTGHCSQSAQQANTCENREEGVKMASDNEGRASEYQTICGHQTDVDSLDAQKGEPDIESDGPRTFRSWWKREGFDETRIATLGGITSWMGQRVCCVIGKTESELSNLLQIGLGESEIENQHRSGRILASFQETSRQEARQNAGFIRVESVQVLERGHPDLEQFTNAEGDIYFHDIGLSRHPSFTVNECLVHNSSILKAFDGKTRNLILAKFKHTPFRLACTATPSPNDHMELGNHAEFVGAMTRTEMLSMFFIHDGGDTSQWRLKGHAEKQFWKWVCSWAVMIRKPADLGYDNGGFDLPPLNMIEHIVKTDKPMNGYLLPMPASTLQERRGARRESISERVEIAANLVKGNTDQWMFWCGLNDESAAIAKAVDGEEVRGDTSMEERERILAGFLDGSIRCIVSKASIFGFGLNLQNCCNTACVGISDSYEEMYQLLRRFWRFGQKNPVNAHIIISDMEGAVLANIKRKEADAKRMAEEMVKHMHSINEANIRGTARTHDAYVQDVAKGERFTLHMGDCVEVCRKIKTESVGFTVFSPPFDSLYTYSASDRDMGNCKNPGEFAEHFKFLVPELFRVTKMGRLVSFHCMNLPTSKTRDGYIGLRDFRGELIRMFIEAGWIFHSEVCIWKDPVTSMQRTKALGLLHKQVVKDSCMSRQGVPDYLVTMRKPGENPNPVEGELDRWIGDDTFRSDGRLSIDIWQRYASPVWMDINPSRTLQKESAREDKDERHICPLQLDVIERAMELWSNPGDVVLSPFAGIGSEGVVALQNGRKFIGIELKASYWKQAAANLEKAESEANRDLFAQTTA